MSSMGTKSIEMYCLLFWFVVLQTQIVLVQQITEDAYHVLKNHVPTGTPIAQAMVRSKIECVALCQRTPHCTSTETVKDGKKILCKLFDKTITISQQASSGTPSTLAVKGKWTNTLF